MGTTGNGRARKDIANVRRAIVITEYCTNVHTVMATMLRVSNLINKPRRQQRNRCSKVPANEHISHCYLRTALLKSHMYRTIKLHNLTTKFQN